MKLFSKLALSCTLPLIGAAGMAASPALEIKPGDHIAIIGNTLADRFQHSGWLETSIYYKYPNHDLVFRNLAVAGDEVSTRHRPDSFGSPDDWLKKTQADVIFAFFGFNESFRGPAGLPKFRTQLDSFIKDTLSKSYSSKGPPRLVLFSPIANEKQPDTLPDPDANNEKLAAYTQAMSEAARAHGVLFVDLFAPSQELYVQAARHGESLTINGLHLTDTGDKLIAETIVKALFDHGTQTLSRSALGKLRDAINEKNEQWHARYRTVDGNNVYGGRSALAYEPDKGGFITDRNAPAPHVSNYKIMQEEMSQRDVMTANRDKRVWALAKGKDFRVEDCNLPEVTRIKSNKPGPNPDQSFQFLGGEEAISKMKVRSGMKVNLFASEERFPELSKPVQMAWDPQGRLWVAVWPNYPERTPDSKTGDSLLVFEDTNGDGKADKCTHFIDDLNAPTGFQFYKDGVLLMEAPDLWFVRDSNRDGRADWKERVLMGLSSADSHHTANALCLDPGGAVYLSDGVFHRTQVETARGPVRNNDAAIFRFEPRSGKFETYVAYDFANPHGRVFDYWGNDLITDGTGNNTYFGPAFSGHTDYPEKHRGMKEFWDRPSRPCAGTALLTSRHFPEEFQGNFLNCNVIGFQGIFRVKVTEDGSGLKGERLEDLISSSDPNFRPVAVNVGPDGAVYFCDWQNPIIGHMQHHLRDPNRDHAHGRIYRIAYEGRPLIKPLKLEGRSIHALLELLKEPENQTREWVKIELSRRKPGEVIAAVKKWAASVDPHDPAYEHHLMEALWVHQWLNVVNVELLTRMLKSPEYHARAAAGRVLCYWRDRVPDVLAWIRNLADDENPRVRLEAARAASFFQNTEAVDAALVVLKHPADYYLDYTLHETLRQLEPSWRKAIETGQPLATDNPAGGRFLLSTIATAELLKLPRSSIVLEALLTRSDATDSDRMVALGDLAKARGTNLVAVLISELDARLQMPIGNFPAARPPPGERVKREGKKEAPGRKTLTASPQSSISDSITLARLLPYQLPDKLKTVRGRLEELAADGNSAELRQGAWAALALADDSFDSAWTLASKSPDSLAELVNSIPLLTDPEFRARAYERVKPLVQEPVSPGALSPVTPDQAGKVRRAAIRALVSMNHEPQAVFSALTDLIVRGQEIPAAAQALRIVPPSKWPRAEAGTAASSLVSWAKAVPASQRTTAEYGEIVQLASDLSGLLPAEKAAGLRHDLQELRVPLFVIRTVREQMRYDTSRLIVEAAKPFEIVFENGDFMPHNLVLCKPNTRDSLGLAAANMKPDELDSAGRLYVPKTSDIFGATKMLQPGQRESLELTAPTIEGDYEYFCTFPGHYQVMVGKLVVTRDIEAYLQLHPEAPLPPSAAAALLQSGSTREGHDHAHPAQ